MPSNTEYLEAFRLQDKFVKFGEFIDYYNETHKEDICLNNSSEIIISPEMDKESTTMNEDLLSGRQMGMYYRLTNSIYPENIERALPLRDLLMISSEIIKLQRLNYMPTLP